MRFMKRGSRGLAVAAVIAAGALLAGCTNGGGSPGTDDADAGTPVDGGTLSYAINTEPTNWNIHSQGTDIIAALQRNVFDSLVFQQTSGEFAPWLAKSWDISDDGLHYTFQLRDDVTFTDGAAFNAEVVKANFDHILDPDTASQYGVGLFGPVTDIEVLGEYEVRVNFSEAFAPFMQAASTVYLAFYSPDALANPDELNNVMAAVGTGPFKVGSYLKGQEIEYVQNPDYNWAPDVFKHQGPTHLDKLVVRFITEDSARVGALSSEQVNVAGGLPPSSAETLEGNPQLKIQENAAPGIPYSLLPNVDRAPLDDLNVRLAIQHALPLDQIVETIYFGQYARAWGPLTPSTIGYDKAVEGSTDYDADLANKLLDEAGWTETNADGYRMKDGNVLTLDFPVVTPQREQRDVIGQSLASALKEVGIKLDVNIVDVGTYMDKLFSGDYDIVDRSFVRADGDALRLHLSSALIPLQNSTRVDDSKMDALLVQSLETTDLSERNKVFGEVQKMVVNEAWIIPIYVPGFIWGTTANIHGIKMDANGWPLFYDAWMKP